MEDDQDDEDIEPGPEITRALFLEWRAPRHGRTNPERMNNPVWDWLIRSRRSAYSANKEFSGPSSFDAGPCWSFSRFGQSKTTLPDGRVVLIAGEHEDSYDPDFFIYNDVVVRNPDGTNDIYCYPKEDFPPTDFHSATPVGDSIVMIGSLGYHGKRKFGTTQVYALELPTLAIRPMPCIGTPPGWLHKHAAIHLPDEDAIVVTGGRIDTGDPDRPLVENIDDWKLHLGDRRWERLTTRRWPRWDIRREDGTGHALFDIGTAAFWRGSKVKREAEDAMNRVRERLGFEPDLDLFGELYDPPVPHEKVPRNEDEYNVRRITVNGVTVRYVEDMWSIQLTVEGDLPSATSTRLINDLAAKLSALERTRYETVRL